MDPIFYIDIYESLLDLLDLYSSLNITYFIEALSNGDEEEIHTQLEQMNSIIEYINVNKINVDEYGCKIIINSDEEFDQLNKDILYSMDYHDNKIKNILINICNLININTDIIYAELSENNLEKDCDDIKIFDMIKYFLKMFAKYISYISEACNTVYEISMNNIINKISDISEDDEGIIKDGNIHD